MTERHAEQRELDQIESTIGELQRQVQNTREELGNQKGASAGRGDVGQLVTNVKEQEELIGVLEDRRGKLRERMGLGAQG
jgi:hypothetical protein